MALARELFQCECAMVRLNRHAAARCSAGYSLKVGDAASFEQALQICQRELDKLVTPYSTAARVRKLMLEQRTAFPHWR
jgi:hypothetical protein